MQFLHVARVTLKAVSPVMIAAGGSDPNLDVVLVRDVNGLPMLPATSIAGVIQANIADDPELKALFGSGGNVETSLASQIIFSDGLAHLQDDRPIDGLLYHPKKPELWISDFCHFEL